MLTDIDVAFVFFADCAVLFEKLQQRIPAYRDTFDFVCSWVTLCKHKTWCLSLQVLRHDSDAFFEVDALVAPRHVEQHKHFVLLTDNIFEVVADNRFDISVVTLRHRLASERLLEIAVFEVGHKLVDVSLWEFWHVSSVNVSIAEFRIKSISSKSDAGLIRS